MIKVIARKGSYTCTRIFFGKMHTHKGKEVTPGQLLYALLENGYKWKVDYSNATEGELFRWFRADLVLRAFKTLKDGKLVFFRDEKFSVDNKEEMPSVFNKLQQKIGACEKLITIEEEDEERLVVGVREYVQ